MHHLGDGTGAGDFVVKLYNGAAKQEGSNSNMFGHFVNDEIGTFDRLRVHSAGGVDAISSVYPVSLLATRGRPSVVRLSVLASIAVGIPLTPTLPTHTPTGC